MSIVVKILSPEIILQSRFEFFNIEICSYESGLSILEKINKPKKFKLFSIRDLIGEF
jgi:hypothetical protein